MNSRPQTLISQLHLQPHPEGGHYSEIYRSISMVGFGKREREALTTIYFLLGKEEVSRWHLVDADEVWHFYEGDGLELFIMSPDFSEVRTIQLGEAGDGKVPVFVIPAGWWQAARSIGEYALCGCTVAPAFEFAGFRFLNEEEKEQVKKNSGLPAQLL